MADGLHHGSAKNTVSGFANVFGILYAEDFDNPSEHGDNPPDQSAPEPPPALTQADVDSACAAAVLAAQVDWKNGDEQMRVKAIASLGPVLASIRDASEQSAIAIAEATVTTILSIVTGLLPHFSREHGAAEVTDACQHRPE